MHCLQVMVEPIFTEITHMYSKVICNKMIVTPPKANGEIGYQQTIVVTDPKSHKTQCSDIVVARHLTARAHSLSMPGSYTNIYVHMKLITTEKHVAQH